MKINFTPPTPREIKIWATIALVAIACYFFIFDPFLIRSPNIILITTDTLRPDHLGCYGYKKNTSPNLDSFAKEALIYKSCYAHASKTAPSIASLFSGYYPHETTVTTNGVLPKDVLTLPKILHKKGYKTAAVVSNFVLRDGQGFENGFDFYDSDLSEKEKIRKLPERTADGTTFTTNNWLERNYKNKFFLWVHYQDPHGPYTPPSPYNSMFLDDNADKTEIKLSKDFHGKGGIPTYQYLKGHRNLSYYVSQYDGEIRYFDFHLGKLFAKLKELNVYEDSLIIFTSDHGESLGEKDYYFCHGESTYKEVIHVPLIVKWNKLKGVIENPVQHIDLLPTILRLNNPLFYRYGRGTNLFKNKNMPIFSEQEGWLSYIKENWNLIFNFDEKVFELYNLQKDPGQLQNKSKDKSHEEIHNELKHDLAELVRENKLKVSAVKNKLDKKTIEALKALGYM